VVAAAWDELSQLNSPALLYRSPAEFIFQIRQSLENKDKKRELLINFARQQDWAQRITQLINTLEDS
jgi:hypothetical protein